MGKLFRLIDYSVVDFLICDVEDAGHGNDHLHNCFPLLSVPCALPAASYEEKADLGVRKDDISHGVVAFDLALTVFVDTFLDETVEHVFSTANHAA